jgi:hypothetical protein
MAYYEAWHVLPREPGSDMGTSFNSDRSRHHQREAYGDPASSVFGVDAPHERPRTRTQTAKAPEGLAAVDRNHDPIAMGHRPRPDLYDPSWNYITKANHNSFSRRAHRTALIQKSIFGALLFLVGVAGFRLGTAAFDLQEPHEVLTIGIPGTVVGQK